MRIADDKLRRDVARTRERAALECERAAELRQIAAQLCLRAKTFQVPSAEQAAPDRADDVNLLERAGSSFH